MTGRTPAATGSHRSTAETVRTSDGLDLHVEADGPEDADVVVVLAHGWTQSHRTWHHQARDLPHLARRSGRTVRVVRYDHRGHGRSSATPEQHATIERLGADLGRVIDEHARSGALVLGGHSMGGMAIMALAQQRPELVDERVAGALLVSSSAGGLHRVTLGLPRSMGSRLRERLPRLLALRARMLSRRRRRRPPTIEAQVVRRFLLGRPVRAADHQVVLTDLVATPAASMCGFFADLMRHERTDALECLRGVPTRVLVGERDRLTAPVHARRLREAMPWAELDVLAGAGHMLPLERDVDVTQALAALVESVTRVPRKS